MLVEDKGGRGEAHVKVSDLVNLEMLVPFLELENQQKEREHRSLGGDRIG